jgi:putative GTP pyrophosphokinase
MVTKVITASQEKTIDKLVAHFVANELVFVRILDQLRSSIETNKELYNQVHSLKWRVKDPEHLKDKLVRKFIDAKESGKSFDITTENLFTKINDLAGFRILHLYTRQLDNINKALLGLIEEEHMYRKIEGPIARTWDDESRDYFKEIGIKTKKSPSLYTSVHYVIETRSRTKYTCEIQVRTLLEEVWGEVDHKINYPHPTANLACGEQIKVLARVTSGCSRLVDSIFATNDGS